MHRFFSLIPLLLTLLGFQFYQWPILSASEPETTSTPPSSQNAPIDTKKSKHITYDNPANTDEDFIIQGEYLSVGLEDPSKSIGMQIIALGENAFEAVHYPGGLPGLGWNGDRSNIRRIKASREPGETTVVFTAGTFIAEVDGNKIFLSDPHQKKTILELERLQRQSPTLGATPPAKGKYLFHHKNLDQPHINHFTKSRVTTDGLLMEGATSMQTFNDFTLHVEFRLPYMPTARGQARGNSGLYLQGRYEVQILDSFGLEGKDNECGGLYKIAAPKLNVCYPPLTWQTFDIDFTAARFDGIGKKTTNAKITVKHNGVIIHENQEIPHVTGAAPISTESATAGPIHLQNHGNPVRYRNLWIVPKSS